MVDDPESTVEGDGDGHPAQVGRQVQRILVSSDNISFASSERTGKERFVCRLHSLSLGDGVHGGREEGAVEGDLLGHLGLEGDFRGLQKSSPSCMLRNRRTRGEGRV